MVGLIALTGGPNTSVTNFHQSELNRVINYRLDLPAIQEETCAIGGVDDYDGDKFYINKLKYIKRKEFQSNETDSDPTLETQF